MSSQLTTGETPTTLNLPLPLMPVNGPVPPSKRHAPGRTLVVKLPVASRKELVALGRSEGFHAIARPGAGIAYKLNNVVRPVEHLVELGSTAIVKDQPFLFA